MLDPLKCANWATPQTSRSMAQIKNNESMGFGKKRIGNYSYNLKDCIGSGYSSHVFKGCKNDNKDFKYAIKVVKLGKMTKGHYQLLQNEIKILKELDHPNIIKLYDVYYTQNNCYMVTQYCEGGTLQSNIDACLVREWSSVFEQLLQACSYLHDRLIIHRDIKPANIFLSKNVWKIGDFGFARYLPYSNAQISEMYMIGSPLYMPPETLAKNIYSLKTDTFALGILFFNLITKKFPWSGNNKKELLESYATVQYPAELITNIPLNFQQFIRGLCEMDISHRLLLTDFQASGKVSSSDVTDTTLATEDQVLMESIGSHDLNLDIVERMKISKFISYIDQNIQHLPEMSQTSNSLKSFLKLVCLLFGWFTNESFTVYINEFNCASSKEFYRQEELIQFYHDLERQIESLDGTIIRGCQVLRFKLIQLSQVLRCFIRRDYCGLKFTISKLVLHSDFSKVLISTAQANEVEKLRNHGL